MATAFDTFSGGSPYKLREDVNAEKDRLSAERIASIKALGTGLKSAAGQDHFQAPSQGQSSSPFQSPLGGKPISDVFSSFQSVFDKQDPATQALRLKVQSGVEDGLTQPQQGLGISADVSRNNLINSLQAARSQQRADLARSFGGQESSIPGALADFDQRAIMQRGQFESDIAGKDEEARRLQKNQALTNAMGYLGQRDQTTQNQNQLAAGLTDSQLGREFQAGESAIGRGFQADQSAQDRAYQAEQNQLGRQLTIEEAAKERAFQSSENKGQQSFQAEQSQLDRAYQAEQNQLGRAMTIEEAAKERAFKASETKSGQSFQAQQSQLDRDYQAEQNQLGRSMTIEEAAKERGFQEVQNGLNRTLQLGIEENRTRAQAALQTSEQGFTERMTRDGWVNDKEMETLKTQFARDLQAQGFTQQQALQAAEFQFKGLEGERDRAFQSSQQEIQRKWTTGERVGDQEFKTSLQGLQNQFEATQSNLDRVLNLDMEKNRQAFQESSQAAAEAHQLLLQNKEMTQEAAVLYSQQIFQAQMTARGFDQDQILQAQKLVFEGSENAKQRTSQELMFYAQQAQSDTHFAQSLGLDKDRLALQRTQLETETAQTAQQMGLQKEQWEIAKQDNKVKQALEMASIGMEMTNGDEEAIKPFADMLSGVVKKYAAENGITLNQSSTGTTGATPATSVNGAVSNNKLDSSLSYFDSISGDLGSNVNQDAAKKAINMVATQPFKDGQSVMASVDKFIREQKYPGVQDVLQFSPGSGGGAISRGGASAPSMIVKPGKAQILNDFSAFIDLKDAGLTDAQASDVIIKTVGADRFNSAYSAFMKKAYQ